MRAALSSGWSTLGTKRTIQPHQRLSAFGDNSGQRRILARDGLSAYDPSGHQLPSTLPLPPTHPHNFQSRPLHVIAGGLCAKIVSGQLVASGEPFPYIITFEWVGVVSGASAKIIAGCPRWPFGITKVVSITCALSVRSKQIATIASCVRSSGQLRAILSRRVDRFRRYTAIPYSIGISPLGTIFRFRPIGSY